MDALKVWIVRRFEAILIILISITLLVTHFLIDQKIVFLNFYFLPVLISGYFLSKKQAVLASFFIIGLVVLLICIDPASYLEQISVLNLCFTIIIWGGFLVLAAYIVGTLHEQNLKKMSDIRMAYIGIVEILSKYLESFDRYTKGHSVRVAEHATEIATVMQLSRDEIENIRVAALLHDIGKVQISSDVINKAASLTKEEKLLVDQHAEKGAKLLSSVGSMLQEAINIVLSHHRHFVEKTDKEGTAIPRGARILAVADSYDAMISDRPYRKGKTAWEAMLELERCSGTQFDPEVVAAFKLVVSAERA
jgi:putative nucleotidyltransferase with HDIG domain